eukprot:6309288-Amphidinium_carterae.1
MASGSSRLVSPMALPTTSTSRSMRRWIKVKDRLLRLASLPIPTHGKLFLWRATILPIVTYDMWSLLPT